MRNWTLQEKFENRRRSGLVEFQILLEQRPPKLLPKTVDVDYNFDIKHVWVGSEIQFLWINVRRAC